MHSFENKQAIHIFFHNSEKVDYRKKPVCRAVKVPIEYINKTVQHEITGLPIGYEVCQVVLNGVERNVQKVYRTDCYNG